MTKSEKYLIAIAGPTAVGKTDMAIRLAKRLSTEIVSCDSRQFYRELEIGTAKPSKEELNSVPHHFVNTLRIDEQYTVKQYEKEALEVIAKLHRNHHIVVMVGGSGLFYRSVCDGLDEVPDVDPKVRIELMKEYDAKGLEYLQKELKERDPELYERMDIQNPQRLIRALEVCRGTGKPFSDFRREKRKERPFSTIKIGLHQSSEALYDRINSRMDRMLEAGLKEEAESFFPKRHLNALQTVGYKEIFDYLEGKYDWEECVRLLKRNSRRYAKRQMTWFRKDEGITWYDLDDYSTLDELEAAIWKQSLSHLA